MVNELSYTWGPLTSCRVPTILEALSVCPQHPPHHPHFPEDTLDDLVITPSAASTSWGSAHCNILASECCISNSELFGSWTSWTFFISRWKTVARPRYHSRVEGKQLGHRTIVLDIVKRRSSIFSAFTNIRVDSEARSRPSFGGIGTMTQASPECLTVRTYGCESQVGQGR